MGGPVFYAERVTGPAGAWGWIAGLGVAAVLGVGSAALLSLGGVPAMIGGVLVGLLAFALAVTTVSFRRLQLRVDREGIRWSFGPLFTRFYALDEVTMFRARDFAFRKAGGWGIGRAYDGVDVYQVWGANGTVLDLVVNRGGVAKHYLVSSVAPDLVCAALVRANAAATAKV